MPEITARPFLQQRQHVAIHREQGSHLLVIPGGHHRPVNQARILEPVGSAPAHVVGTGILTFRKFPERIHSIDGK